MGHRNRRFLRWVVNWTVERYFPEGIFWGPDAQKKFENFDKEYRGGKMPLTVYSMLVSRVAESSAVHFSLDIEGLSIKGRDLGDWSMKIDRIREPVKEPS